MSLEYNGKPSFSRKRKLIETERPVENTQIPPIQEDRSVTVDQAFVNVAKSYLKGKVVKEALSKMDPAQWIPIEDTGVESAAAIRISEEQSKNGTIITYSMFQSCVDYIIDNRKNISGEILSGTIPATVSKQIEQYSSSNSGGLKVFNPLIEWVKDNGVACSLLAAITISPWVTEFYALSAEEASSKTVHISKVVLAICILLEIGAKYDSIIAIFKNASLSVPGLESEVDRLSRSRKTRRDLLAEFDIDLDEFTQFNKSNDCQLIVNYVNKYYARYGGLQFKDGYLTIDHWLGYLQVAQANQLLKTTINNAAHFSPKFRTILDKAGSIPPDANTKFSGGTSRPLGITISIINSTARYTNDMYDDIVNALSYYLDDKALCCLVQIFGKAAGQDTLYSMAVLLRLLAMDFGITMSVVFDKFTRTLVDKMQDVLMDLLTKLNEFYDKVALKITDAFTINIDNYTACSGMITLGWALLHAVRVLFEKIKSLIKRVSAILGEFSNGFGSRADWATVADRRFLFGCSRILELLSNKIILANNCASSESTKNQFSDNLAVELDNPNILSILEKAEPIIPISEEDRKKYFNNTIPSVSSRLKTIYGINPQQNNEDATATPSSCEEQRDKSVDTDIMVKNLISSINAVFHE